ncbi:MAG: AMP-binding protein [Acetobacteraceae bacterium]
MSSVGFKAARDVLLPGGSSLRAARQDFQWPQLDRFNWALDWFDAELAAADSKDNCALRIVGDSAENVSFAAMSARSSQIANGLRGLGVRRGDRILLMLGNVAPLWETMLAAMKLGAIVIPSTLLLTVNDLAERVRRARVRHLIVSGSETGKFASVDPDVSRICTGVAPPGWLPFDSLRDASPIFVPDGETRADDPMLLYFTSGTTSQPKMVLHSHRTFPVGHLATMHWIGARPGDVHMAVGAPGWAGHTFMAFFGPWNAGATVLILNQPRFDGRAILDTLVAHRVASFFAPPTVWRMLLQQALTEWPVVLREAVAAGEPLNPEVIEQVRAAWGLTVRDGWGQTEATVQIANAPNDPVNVGALGTPLPGCSVTILDDNDNVADEGELALPLDPRPQGLMVGYLRDDGTLQPIEGRHYRTGDAVRRNADGTYTYVGRTDDVFKSSDYRISPFELESVLIEHPAVVEAAVVPSPDELRLSVPKAFIALAVGHEPDRNTALSIFQHSRKRLAAYKRIRRIAFADLPKTVSGKIRRVDLRRQEALRGTESPSVEEFREENFPEVSA